MSAEQEQSELVCKAGLWRQVSRDVRWMVRLNGLGRRMVVGKGGAGVLSGV